MAMFDELDKQTWRERSRLARERSDLSASVEVALADETLSEDDWLEPDDLEDPGDLSEKSPEKIYASTVIPPRLSLQSRPMESVSPGTPLREMATAQPTGIEGGGGSQRSPLAAAQSGVPVGAEQSENVLMRLAHRITTSLASIGSVLQPAALVQPAAEVPKEAPKVPAQESIEGALPEPPMLTSHVDGIQTMKIYPSPPRTPVVVESRPLPAPFPSPAPRPAGRLGRTTKVHLKVAPKTEKIVENRRPQQPPAEIPAATQPLQAEQPSVNQPLQNDAAAAPEPQPLVVLLDTSAHMPAVKAAGPEASTEAAPNSEQPVVPPAAVPIPGMLFGSGRFEEGQSDLVVSNAAIQASSVVVVMLTGDPGPVVVQYCSLQSGTGFTVHLSAAARKQTPFNYVLLGANSVS